MEGDRVYFERRASEERSAAMKAAHPKAREVHLELASRYDERLGEMAAGDAPNITPLVDVA